MSSEESGEASEARQPGVNREELKEAMLAIFQEIPSFKRLLESQPNLAGSADSAATSSGGVGASAGGIGATASLGANGSGTAASGKWIGEGSGSRVISVKGVDWRHIPTHTTE